MEVSLAGDRDAIDAALEHFARTRSGASSPWRIMTRRHASARSPAQPFGWLAKPYQSNSLVRCVRDALSKIRRP